MEKYSSYKDSGFAWMGQIPSHWETRRFRFLLAENSLQNTDLKERKQLQFKYGDIVPKANQSEDKDVLDTIKKYTVVAPGDIMINGLNLNYDFISQRVAQVQEPGVITSAYVSLRPLEGANSKYYTYYMKAMDAQKMFHGMGSGVRLTLSYDNLKNLFFPYPSPEEQDAMVEYLDAATAKIDEAIAQQQRMIVLLNERKQIMIDRTVSRGIPSVDNAPVLKESGYDWLGQIPAHWDINKLKYLCKMFRRIGFRGYSAEDLVEEGEGAVTLSPTNIIEGKLDFTECSYLSWQKYYESPEIMVFPGDVIFVKTASIGKTAYVESIPIETTVNPQILVLKDIIPNSEYLTFYLQSSFMQGWVKATANGSTILTIPQTTIGNYPIALPSTEEQMAIVDYLKEEIGKIERAKNSVNNTINFLQERKQIIINDVVTGKVRIV